jgi:hypothetical protein
MAALPAPRPESSHASQGASRSCFGGIVSCRLHTSGYMNKYSETSLIFGMILTIINIYAKL